MPCRVDLQNPHSRGEFYIVVAGTGTFFCAGERTDFNPRDFLHVPATFEHRFENFSEDFVTWVLFMDWRVVSSLELLSRATSQLLLAVPLPDTRVDQGTLS